ncbi:MAG: hypothetical protein K6E63_02570 [Lachnospiraceae bacterium]|nr:hypothetical protein [Lachnospiraceae bacterium]
MSGILIRIALAAAMCGSVSFLPAWAQWSEVTVTNEAPLTDEDPDLIELKERRVTAYKDGDIVYESPDDCLVQEMLYSDIDDDGRGELVILNFRKGRHNGPKPFFVEDDHSKWFQHIYIYDYYADEKVFKPSWMASDIGMDAVDMTLLDDGVIRILNRQGHYSNWKWKSFGLKNIDGDEY